jgi:hypothetical protein
MSTYLYTTEDEVKEAWDKLMSTRGHRFVTLLPDGTTIVDADAEHEAFNNFVDDLQKSGEIPAGMFYPGYDEDDPDGTMEHDEHEDEPTDDQP